MSVVAPTGQQLCRREHTFPSIDRPPASRSTQVSLKSSFMAGDREQPLQGTEEVAWSDARFFFRVPAGMSACA